MRGKNWTTSRSTLWPYRRNEAKGHTWPNAGDSYSRKPNSRLDRHFWEHTSFSCKIYVLFPTKISGVSIQKMEVACKRIFMDMKSASSTNPYTVQDTQSPSTFKIQMPTKSHFNKLLNKKEERDQDRFEAEKQEVYVTSTASDKLDEFCTEITNHPQTALALGTNHVMSIWLHKVFKHFKCVFWSLDWKWTNSKGAFRRAWK